jgi:hypothetical protein
MDRRKTEGQGKYGLVRRIFWCWRHSKTHDPRLFFFVAEEEALYVRSSGAEDKSINMLSPKFVAPAHVLGPVKTLSPGVWRLCLAT